MNLDVLARELAMCAVDRFEPMVADAWLNPSWLEWFERVERELEDEFRRLLGEAG